ncbi:hypothetical protein [Granulicella paludicola]|uniref:hypothetical protein n=1 Tax=Granulicella paludicola TaxID=474951 RepID=UPI0021E0F27B|nr:hypothetical protein [Granulicella paludicola]
MKDLSTANFDTMTTDEFQEYLPELFAEGGGNVSKDPRFAKFLENNPVCAELVHDLETIAETAKSLFEPTHEPSDDLWNKIAGKLHEPEEEN